MTRHLRFAAIALVAASALICAGTARAELLKHPQWQAWLDDGRTVELERAAQARLQAQADDAQAAVALALVALQDGDAGRAESLDKPLKACVERQPAMAACYYALGAIQGVQAMNGGMFKAMRLAGDIKDNFGRAVELDPLLFPARQGLVQFYLMLPSVAGGSPAKAREIAAAAEARQPEHAKLLRAAIAQHDKQWSELERELQSVKTGNDKALQHSLRDAWAAYGVYLIGDKQHAKARTVFANLQRDYPAHAIGTYGLGRVAVEAGQPDEAIALLEKARALDGAERLPIDHRLGLALLAKGDKPQAKAALERFVASKRPNPRNLEDAKKRLAELS